MKAIVDGLATEYTDEGQGPVLLMLHGWGDNLHTFDLMLPHLTNHRIVRLDLPGFGNTEKPHTIWGVGEYANFVAEFCKKIGIEPDIILGHSFGGRILLKGVGTGMVTPKKIVLIASAGIAKHRTIKNTVFRYVAKLGKLLTLIPPFSFYRHRIRKKIYRALGSDYFAAGSMGPIFRKVVAEDLLPFASLVRVPTLLVWGSEDASTPLENGEKIHAAIPGSELKVFHGASHFVHQERAEEVAQAISMFI